MIWRCCYPNYLLFVQIKKRSLKLKEAKGHFCDRKLIPDVVGAPNLFLKYHTCLKCFLNVVSREGSQVQLVSGFLSPSVPCPMLLHGRWPSPLFSWEDRTGHKRTFRLRHWPALGLIYFVNRFKPIMKAAFVSIFAPAKVSKEFLLCMCSWESGPVSMGLQLVQTETKMS